MLELFLTFLKIGAVSFGGGYGMISLVREEALSHGWLTSDEFINMIAVAESTPGPIAINMATFIGSNEYGILGSALATLGVVLPAFTIILIISALIKNFIKYKGVQAFLSGVQPCVVALILSTAATMLLSSLLGFEHIGDSFEFNIVGIIVLPIIVLISALWKKWKKKKPSPILLIIISAVLGMVLSPIFNM
ncbi:MAG: chromate transporter [Clostridia bacterium]|nr:chromate transporter [Clostridia bacterium]